MEPQFKTSFIPKESLVKKKRSKKPVNILTVGTLIIFFVTILLAVSIFLYGEYLKVSISNKEEQLSRARGAFEPALIKELTRVDERIEATGKILDEHTSMSLFFEFLESNTLENVRFNELLLTAMDSDRYFLNMSGSAASFASVALQSDVFGESEVLSEPIFSNLDLDIFGNVSFNVDAFVNADDIRYRKTVELIN